MENETTSKILGDIADKEQFYGTVPKELEVTLTGICLGAPINFEKDKITGQNIAVMLVPTEDGGSQPAIVTYGKESLGKGAYQALYYQLGVEELMTPKSNEEAAKYLVDLFSKRTPKLGKNNDYASTILGPKFEYVSKYTLESFPEYNAQFSEMKDSYVKMFGAYYSTNKTQTEESIEKKTNNVVVAGMETQTAPKVNA